MAAAQTRTAEQPSDATLQRFVTALQDIAAAVAQNTAELRAAQRSGGFGKGGGGPSDRGERTASAEQLRTALNYQVLSGIMGRSGAAALTVSAQRRREGGVELVEIFGVPDQALTVSVQADGEISPELLGFNEAQGPDRTVSLVNTAGKDIARIELLNSAGEPIRLGPRMPRLPADDPLR